MTRLFNTDWMWDEALAALHHAERRHRRFFTLLAGRTPQPVWEPPADVFETVDGIWIVVALPGVRAAEVKLRLEASELIVQTERVSRAALECTRVRRLEIPYGKFERRIELPPGFYALREQRFIDGCLELLLTKE